MKSKMMPIDASTGIVVQPKPGAVVNKVDAPESVDNISKGDGLDWERLALSGGGGLLGYAIASKLFNEGDDRKKMSAWDKLLSILIPIGVGGLGAYGGYALGGIGKKAASNSTTNNVFYAPTWPDYKPGGVHTTPLDPVSEGDKPYYNEGGTFTKGDTDWLDEIRRYAERKRTTLGDAAERLADDSRSPAWLGGGVGMLGLGAGLEGYGQWQSMLNRQLNRSATLPPADTSALADARNELASRQNDYDTALSDQRDAAGSAADTKRMTAESNAHTKRISALQKYVNDAQKRVAELERANAEYGQRVFDETRSREAMSNRYQNRARLGKWTGRGLGAIGLGSLLKSWWDYDTAGKIEGVGDRLRSEAREWSPKK